MIDLTRWHSGPDGRNPAGIYEVQWEEPCKVCGDIVRVTTEGAYSWFGWVQNRAFGSALCDNCKGATS